MVLLHADEIVDDFSQLPLTRAMLYESLRLYPPVSVMARESIDADILSGYELPEKSFLVIPIYSVHRHPDLWERAEEFDGHRFLDKSENHFRFSYVPFNVGPRACIGRKFSLTELAIFISALYPAFCWETRQKHLQFICICIL